MSQKSLAVVILFACGLVLGVSTQWPVPFQVPEWLSWTLTLISGAAVYWWYRADAEARQYRRRAWLGFSAFLIPILGVPAYLLHSRGLRKGMLASAIALLVALGVMGTSAVAAMLTAWIQWQAG
jgi:hypothetical protein